MDKQALRLELGRLPHPEADAVQSIQSGLRDWMARRLPGTVAAYRAMSSEVPVEPVFDALPGWRWVLVRVEPDSEITFRDRDVPTEMHSFGMRQPRDVGDPVPAREIDVFLVPGVAFTASGHRLGRGGGFYDRILANRRTDSIAVGVVAPGRLVESLPSGDHDQGVEYLATEAGVRDVQTTS